MEKNELRIGNWVLCNGLRTIVNDTLMISILKNDVQFTVEPIPITPEILEKFGFEKTDQFTFSKSGIKLTPIRDLYFRAQFPIKADIKHLHQLQNLYFALTGEELTFKH